ncbi:phosphotransferase [Paenalkalicoccus suaedae]|uniref:Phosphotransferase n=1 Tax=Paenalkalicoccus suaedae TaxID=2592382 RepID=A0A859FE42_9BACI|nr:phosphotransferase [Paenalkalicoccus suaedae]QKS70496.1 phosphotransferase [Paenalkalicoccus suaedae]
MYGIPELQQLKTTTLITKGWSDEEKYLIEMESGEKRLLRVSDIASYEKKQHDFLQMKEIAKSGIAMPMPLAFGTCDQGTRVYALFSWCEGEDAADVLPQSPADVQYKLGVESGQMLKDIHAIAAPATIEPWESMFNRKIDKKLALYAECGVVVDGVQPIIDYLEANRDLLANRPQSFHHGDYHIHNMVVSDNRTLSIIDFNRADYGDPWEEFNRIVWCASVSSPFATGRLHGYFGGEPPELFFRLMALYISSNALSSIAWAIPFGDAQLEVMTRQLNEILTWYDDMNLIIPSWYHANYVSK